MSNTKVPRSTSPHAIGATAAFLVIVVGLGFGFYFIELRGLGLAAMMAGAQAQELLILLGALATVAVTAQVAISHSARPSESASTYTRLLNLAQEIDPTDPEAIQQFDSIPEVRDLVSLWIGEKQQNLALADQVESVRGEMTGLIAGMTRNVEKLGSIREENISELGLQFTALWNKLVERTRNAEANNKVLQSAADSPQTLAIEGQQSSGVGATQRNLIESLETRLSQIEAQLQKELTPQLLQPEGDSGALLAVDPQPFQETAVDEDPIFDLTGDLSVEPTSLPASERGAPIVDPTAVAPESLEGWVTPESEDWAEQEPTSTETWDVNAFSVSSAPDKIAGYKSPSQVTGARPSVPAEVQVQPDPPVNSERFGDWGGGDSLEDLGQQARANRSSLFEPELDESSGKTGPVDFRTLGAIDFKE